jgi:hypothetical protein
MRADGGRGRRRRLPHRLGDARADFGARGRRQLPVRRRAGDLAADVRAVVGAGTKLTYAADWSEYRATSRGMRRATVVPPRSALGQWRTSTPWASTTTCRRRLARRDGPCRCGGLGRAVRSGLPARQHRGRGGHDWYYASDADRGRRHALAHRRRRHGEPWVWRFKDLAGWWGNAAPRPPAGCARRAPTAWVPEGKPMWLTELGCGAVDKGANQPNVFGDPKSSESARPHFSSGRPDALMQRQFLRAHLTHWATGRQPGVRGLWRRCWTWRASIFGPGMRGPIRPFPRRGDVWSDGPNHATGHWLTGRLGRGGDELLRAIAAEWDVALDEVDAAAAAARAGGRGRRRLRDALAPCSPPPGSLRDTPEGLAPGGCGRA